METEQDPETRLYLMPFVGIDSRTLSSIMTTLNNYIRPFTTDEYLTTTLSKKNVITPGFLEQGYDVFLQLPQEKLEQWKRLTSLLIQQFCRHFEQRPEGSGKPILFLLDEFARLGQMPQVVHGLATLRSKKLTIMLIIQSLAQLDVTYQADQRKVICDNCDYKAILRVSDADSQKYFSALVGTEERQKLTHNSKEEGGVWKFILTGENS
jgi:type IV secretion system protein VirD4